jgi:hypothetical protein
MSENNYGALMMKSALSANVDIDSVLQPGIYPVPSGNTSSPDPNGGILTIYPDPSKRRIFASNRFITTPSSYNTLLKQWDEWESLILHSELSDDNGFKLVGQVHSAAALAVLAGEDGDRVLLLGYHDGWAASSSELSGGGEFHYVSSLADVNNGVTIFNGWCRKFTDTVITTYDAGLGDNDGIDARERLTTLFKVVPDGFTVKIRGRHLTSGPVKCEGKPVSSLTA